MHKHWTYFIGGLSGLPSPCETLSSSCVSHFVRGHFLRPRSIYYHQCVHWSMQWHHQSDLHGSESCTIYSSYRPCMTLWCHALLYQAVLQVHWTVWPLRPSPMYMTPASEWAWLSRLPHWALHSWCWWSASCWVDINHANGSVTLFLPLLNQSLPENAMTLNMTKYNTVPTNRSDVTGNIVTEMVTRRTSAVFGELELVRRDIYILQSFTFVNWCCIYTSILHNWILFYQLRSLNCTFYSIPTYRQYMHEVFHSFPPTSPSSAPIWWGAIRCREWWRWLTWCHMHHALWGGGSLTHTCTHITCVW